MKAKKAYRKLALRKKSFLKISTKAPLFYLVTIVFFSFVLAALYTFLSNFSSHKQVINSKAFASSLVKVTEFATPTQPPTPTPTVTPTPDYGYCLNVPVLMYHHTMPWGIAMQKGQTSLDVDSGIFDQQIGYLATHGFTFIFAEDVIHAIKNHTALPPKSISVTLDDGYDDVYAYAFQTLKKYNAKATVMVPTGLLGNSSAGNSYYNWGQLQEMVNSGLISVGNHTWSHYPMGSKDATKDQYEVTTAQQELQQFLGKNPDVFAYPYGTNALNTRIWSLLQHDGFAGAFSTIGGTVQCESYIYALRRTRVGNIPFPAFGIY